MFCRLKLAVVIVSWCLTGFATAVPVSRPLPDEHLWDEYGYGQTFADDRSQAAKWIGKMGLTKSHDNSVKYQRARVHSPDPRATEKRFFAQYARIHEEIRQRLKQNDDFFQQRVAEERSRHLEADGNFTPANDADYRADVRQIQRDFEQRMTEVNEWEEQAHVTHRVELAAELRKKAEEIRDLAMKKAYERHDIRKGGWNKTADYHKRQLAIRRHEQSMGRRPSSSSLRSQDKDHRLRSRPLDRDWKIFQERLIREHERRYAESRPMPTDAEQVAGFPPPPSPPSSSSSSSPSSFSTHQLSLLPAHVVPAARSSLHQLEHTAKRTVKSLSRAFFAWEKRASNSHAPAVQKVAGPLEAE
ncbi:MAG: hypothetical protein M1826_002616 [Phylliscum demangeonii]|nr:MAG: hypothetical protein M1826_002616 [Phylliscum demangeonii]